MAKVLLATACLAYLVSTGEPIQVQVQERDHNAAPALAAIASTIFHGQINRTLADPAVADLIFYKSGGDDALRTRDFGAHLTDIKVADINEIRALFKPSAESSIRRQQLLLLSNPDHVTRA